MHRCSECCGRGIAVYDITHVPLTHTQSRSLKASAWDVTPMWCIHVAVDPDVDVCTQGSDPIPEPYTHVVHIHGYRNPMEVPPHTVSLKGSSRPLQHIA